MFVNFATCNRSDALKYLQTASPGDNITDTPDSAGPVLDLVAKDVLRVQDPLMHGNRIAVIAGNNYSESHEAEVTKAVNVLMGFLASARKSLEAA